VATHFFNAKDTDGTGTLDLSEVEQMLRETFLQAGAYTRPLFGTM